MTDIYIYHNPRCTKSRQALALLEDRGIKPTIVEYLKTPPDEETLNQLLAKLGLTARQVLRTGEPEYKELGLDNPDLTDDQIVAAIVSHPRLLERPIVVRGKHAAIGRPTEAILPLLV